MIKQLQYGWRTANVAKRASLLAITDATDDAVEKGLASMVTIGELDDQFPMDWRCMVRFPAAADRCCDDACRSGHNQCTGLKETIRCVGSDLPARIAKILLQRGMAHSTTWRAGTDDLKQAYWRVPNAQPQYSVVALYHARVHRVVFYL